MDLEQPPYAYVQVQGSAELSEEPGNLVATATAIGRRYMGAGKAAEFGRRNGVPGELVVRLRPGEGHRGLRRHRLTPLARSRRRCRYSRSAVSWVRLIALS